MAEGEARGSGSPSAAATYAGAGVDIGAGDLAVERMKGLVPGIGGFGAQFPLDTARFTQPVLVSSTDGVGTKLTVAQATGRYGTIGLDLVAMCVDDLVCLGAEPLFMLDYIATGKVDPDRIATVVAGIQDGCHQAGCVLIGGETAEHPGVMAPDDLDLAGFAVGAVESATMLGPDRVELGDVIVGIPSPGLRSNGYTLARHVLLERAGRSLGDPAWAGAAHTLADELLFPSVIYTPAVLAVQAALNAGGTTTPGGTGCTPAPTSPAGASSATCHGSSPTDWVPCSNVRHGSSRAFSLRSNGWGQSKRPRWIGFSTGAWAWPSLWMRPQSTQRWPPFPKQDCPPP